jgi:hypothetical protein
LRNGRPQPKPGGLAHAFDVMWPYFDPEPSRRLFVTYLPFMFDQTHGLFESLSGKHFVATNPDQVQFGVPGAAVADPVTLRKALHIWINGKQDRVIGERCCANDIIVDLFGQRFAVKDN